MANYIKMPRSTRKKLMIQSFLRGMDGALDESVLPASVAKRVYNFDFSSGALCEGYGLSAYPIISRPVSAVWLYQRRDFEAECDEEILMYAGTDGKVYYRRHDAEHELLGVQFSSPPRAVNYRLYGDDVILMTSATDPMVVWDGESDAYAILNSPLITSMTLHFERMFCTVSDEKNAVWFSDDLDPTNWDLELDKGGFIQVIDERGKLNRVISFLNYIYVFRDYGISRLTAFSDQSDFSVVNLFVSSGKIYPDSVTLCGNTVLFLASDGLYRFDGLSTQKILPSIAPVLGASPHAIGAFFDGKYYLALSTSVGNDMEDSEGSDADGFVAANNTLLVYDIKTGIYSFVTDIQIVSMGYADGKLLAVSADGRIGSVERAGAIFDEPTKKSWTSGMTDFGTEQLKTVREVYIESDDVFTLTIESERGTREFVVVPSVGITKIRVNHSGRKIGISLAATTKQARITRPTIVFTQ